MKAVPAFTPPGYLRCAELVDLAGRARFGASWTDAKQAGAKLHAVTAEAERRWSWASARVATAPRQDSASRLAPRPSKEEIEGLRAAATAARAAAAQPTRQLDAMRQDVIAALRTALYGGTIDAAILTAQGELIRVPVHFWGGDSALSVFLGLEPVTIPGPLVPIAVGRVLFKRADLDAWLAGPSATAAADVAATERILSEREVKDWISSHFEQSTGTDPMWTACREDLKGTTPRDRFRKLYNAERDARHLAQARPGRRRRRN